MVVARALREGSCNAVDACGDRCSAWHSGERGKATFVANTGGGGDKDIATGLLLSLNKHRLTILCILGSNLTDHKKLGFRDEDALTKAHKSIDLKYLRHLN